MPTCKRVKALVDFGEDSGPDVAHEEEEEMEVHGSKHRKLTRAEKSKNAAKSRRDKEAIEFNNIIDMLPFPNDDLEKMDKSSVVKLTTSYFKMMDYIEKAMKYLAVKEDKDKVVCKQESNSDVSVFPTDTETEESQLMLEALDGFMILLDRKRHILFVSRNVEEHLGLSQVQLIGKSMEEFLEEKDIPELRKQFNLKFLSEGNRSSSDSTETDDVYHQLDDHRMFYLRMLCQYKNNKTKYKGHTLVQWTGRLKMRKTQKANNFATTGLMCICKVMQTNSILEIKMDGNMFMSRHDLGMTFTFCDPRIITLIGYEPSEVIGRTAYQFHNPLDAERVRSCHSNLIVKGSSVSKYYRFVGKNCDWVWMQTRATIIYNTSNKPQYIVCMNYIISEEEGIRVFMEEDKKSLCCTGVMDISCKPFKPREVIKGDNHDDNGYHSSYSPYSSINPSPLSDDCGASVGDTNDDFPMSVVQECASSLDPDANDNEEMIKFIESLDGNENEMEQNNQVLNGNVQWNPINQSQLPSNYQKKQSLQRIKSCPHVFSLLPTDNEFDDQPIEFMCKSPDNSGVPNNGNGSTIPKQGLLNIQIGSFNDGSLVGPSATLSEALPKDISEFCLQYAESMANIQSQDIISQYAQDNFYTKLDSMSNQSQSGQTSCQSFNLNGLGSPGSPQSFGNQQSFTNMSPVLPNTQQSSYPTSPQSFYTRSSDTPNSYLSGSNVSSPQTSYSNLNSPSSVDTNMASPASDFTSNIRSPIPQAHPCSIGLNNLTLNSARSPLMQSPVNQASTSQHQASFPSQKVNGNMILDRNMLLKLNSAGNMSQPNGGSHLVNNNKVRTSGLSLCNNRPVLVRMANQQQNSSQGRTTQNNVILNSNSRIKSSVTQNSNNPPKGLRNVKSMSELEKMLRGYSPPFLQEKDEQSGNDSMESGCTLLQQMLTGKLSGEKYIAMEKQRQLNSAIRTSHP